MRIVVRDEAANADASIRINRAWNSNTIQWRCKLFWKLSPFRTRIESGIQAPRDTGWLSWKIVRVSIEPSFTTWRRCQHSAFAPVRKETFMTKWRWQWRWSKPQWIVRWNEVDHKREWIILLTDCSRFVHSLSSLLQLHCHRFHSSSPPFLGSNFQITNETILLNRLSKYSW
jgi:hypothetical protein